MKTVLRKKNFLSGIPACLLLCITFLLLGSLPLTAGDSTTLGSPGGTLTGYTSKNVSGGSNYIYYPTPGTYTWTIPDDAASKVWVTLAAAGSGGVGECCLNDGATCNPGTSHPGIVGGLVNKQEVSVIPGTVATITVGAAGPSFGWRGCSYIFPNNSGTTAGGNTCFSSSTGTVCATGGLVGWSNVNRCDNLRYACPTYVVAGDPVPAGSAAGAGGWARIDW